MFWKKNGNGNINNQLYFDVGNFGNFSRNEKTLPLSHARFDENVDESLIYR